MIVFVEVHAMIVIGPGNSPTLQFLTSRMLFPMRDPLVGLQSSIPDLLDKAKLDLEEK